MHLLSGTHAASQAVGSGSTFFIADPVKSNTTKNIIMVEFAYFMVEYPLKCVFCSSTMNTVKGSTQNTVNFEKHIKKGEQNNDDE